MRDIETAAARKLSELVSLTVGEVGTCRCQWNGVTHVVEEDGLEAQHPERYIKQSVVDGCMDACSTHQGCLCQTAATEATGSQCQVSRWIWQLSYMEYEWRHRAGLSLVARRYVDSHVLAHCRWCCHEMTVALRYERTATHRSRDGIGWHARHTDTDRILKTCIEHVHQVCRHCCGVRRRNHTVFLDEVALHHVALGIVHQNVAGELMFSHSTCRETILSTGTVHSHAVHVDFRLLGGIHGSHHDIGIESFTRIERCFLWNHEGIEFVHTDILHVDIRNQVVQHLSLGIAHIALNLREHGHGCSHWHVLKHVFLPVLTQIFLALRHLGREVAGDDFLLMLIGHQLQDAVAVAIQLPIEFLSLARTRCKHHDAGSLQVFLVLDVAHIAILTVSLLYDSNLQFLGKVIERIAHVLHLLSLLEPFPHLGRVLLHLVGKVAIDCIVLCGRVGCGSIQTVFHNRESVEHLRRDVQRKHSHQDDVHQVNHLLAW